MASDGFCDDATRTILSTPSGPVAGLVTGDIATFRGVPYAQPPVGGLRFAAPVRRARWSEAHDGTRFGATAQRQSPGFAMPEPAVPGDDILNVTIFTRRSAAPNGQLPVVVWIHGGGYVAGSPVSDWYDGRALAAEGVVVVSIGYRLALDGFGVLPGHPTNRAVLDWICALEWVRDEIAAYGGDPGNITIAGQSAGGGAVLALTATRAADGLFQRAWSLSGVLTHSPVQDAADGLARTLHARGLTPTETDLASTASDGLLDPVDPIGGGQIPWNPVDDELFPHGLVAGLAGSGVPLVAGATADEWFWAPVEPDLDDDGARTLLAALGADPVEPALEAVRAGWGRVTDAAVRTEALFRAAVVRAAATRPNAETWVYDYRVPRRVGGRALHCDDIPAFFGLHDQRNVVDVLGDAGIDDRRALHADVVAFAHGTTPSWSAPADGPLAGVVAGLRVRGDARPSDGFATAAAVAATLR
ncbi:MAG: carboxylesterase family protein [Microbacterium sp.]